MEHKIKINNNIKAKEWKGNTYNVLAFSFEKWLPGNKTRKIDKKLKRLSIFTTMSKCITSNYMGNRDCHFWFIFRALFEILIYSNMFQWLFSFIRKNRKLTSFIAYLHLSFSEKKLWEVAWSFVWKGGREARLHNFEFGACSILARRSGPGDSDVRDASTKKHNEGVG